MVLFVPIGPEKADNQTCVFFIHCVSAATNTYITCILPNILDGLVCYYRLHVNQNKKYF